MMRNWRLKRLHRNCMRMCMRLLVWYLENSHYTSIRTNFIVAELTLESSNSIVNFANDEFSRMGAVSC